MATARDRILKAAHRIYARDGLAGLSLRRVAAAVNLTPMAIYRHFRNKDAIIDALVAAGFEEWEGYLAEAVQAPDPEQKMRRGLLAYRDFALAKPRTFELMFLTRRKGIPLAPASLAETTSPSFGLLIQAVADMLKERGSAESAPAELLLFAWSVGHGLIALHFSGRFGWNDDAFRAIYERQVERVMSTLPRRV